MKNNYGNPLLYITENGKHICTTTCIATYYLGLIGFEDRFNDDEHTTGVSEFNNATTLPLEQQLADPMRIDYYHAHLSYLNRAIEYAISQNSKWCF